MTRIRSMLGQSPAIAVAAAALALSLAGGTAAATVASQPTPAAVPWHSMKLLNGWQYAGFGSFHLAYYLDSSHVVHLRGSAHLGNVSQAVFRLPVGTRPAHVLSMVIYTDNGPAEMQIRTSGYAFVINPAGGTATDFSSFDGVSFPLG